MLCRVMSGNVMLGSMTLGYIMLGNVMLGSVTLGCTVWGNAMKSYVMSCSLFCYIMQLHMLCFTCLYIHTCRRHTV